jgi:hypothetical protein
MFIQKDRMRGSPQHGQVLSGLIITGVHIVTAVCIGDIMYGVHPGSLIAGRMIHGTAIIHMVVIMVDITAVIMVVIMVVGVAIIIGIIPIMVVIIPTGVIMLVTIHPGTEITAMQTVVLITIMDQHDKPFQVLQPE